MVVYSITSRSSYDEARAYLDTIAQYQHITGKDIPVAVVGNKMDLERYRSVRRQADCGVCRDVMGVTVSTIRRQSVRSPAFLLLAELLDPSRR